MLELVIGMLFALIVFYVAEKDNEESDLYKILHLKKSCRSFKG